MTTQALEAQQDRQPDTARARRHGSRNVLLILAFVVTALVGGASGVAATLRYQRATAPDTSAVDAEAARFAKALRADLNAGFYSGGQSYGGQFTEGTLVAQVEAHGGVLLSAGTERNRNVRDNHTVEVMLGLTPPAADTVAEDAYPVRCYHYTFGIGSSSVKQSRTSCPASRTDGKPGSLTAQMGVLLTQQPTGRFAYRQMTTAGYAHTPQGAQDFLREKHIVTARDAVRIISGKADSDDVYVLALRINGGCHYLRMDASAAASRLVPLWTAPADAQETCDVTQAAAAATLYGIDPAKAG
jgi:hypothetical protein